MLRHITVFIVFLGVMSYGYGQFPIQGNWKFHAGDDPSWSSPAFESDSVWQSVKVPESLGEEFNGYGWYRVRFVAPEHIRESNKRYYLVAGFISDVDQVYLNGGLLGQTGKFPPKVQSEHYSFRKYPLSSGLLKTENLLAIRVYDTGGTGGIYRGPVGLYTEEQIKKVHQVNSIPHKSIYKIPSSNGLTAIVYNAEKHRITQWLDHIYQQYNPETPTLDLLSEAGFTVYTDTGQYQLSSFSPDQVRYESGTGIISGKFQLNSSLTLSTYHFTPLTSGDRLVVNIAELTGPGARNSRIDFNISDLDPAAVHLSQTYEYSADRSVQVDILGMHPKGKNVILPIVREYMTKYPGMNSLYTEREFWAEWHGQERLPSGLNKMEEKLARQSSAILKMAQVREQGASHGQILASLPPGKWNITWVRDMAYAVEALIQTGHFSEARDALRFQLRADAGKYQHFLWQGKDYGIQTPYRISVCRYYGNGAEWSGQNDDGPNIELDGFGLFLSTLGNYFDATSDVAFLREHWDTIAGEIADPLVKSIDSYGLIRSESGPWERHLPGKHFTFTTVWAIQGLDAAANMALAVNDESAASRYLKAANRLSQGFRLYLVDSKKDVIKGNLESSLPEEYVDGSAVSAIHWLAGEDFEPRLRNTMQAFNTYLKMPRTGPGYMRLASKEWYDTQEWVFLDLRMAGGWFLLGERFRGTEVLDWVTEQSLANYGLIGELYDEYTTDYRGAFPMVGFGAGAYLLTLQNRAENR
ncbi:MAG: hypothetical protein K9N46_07550 [Candidatus Marinimicrobia bacterium]|nr:hypothetical protein [Candidatus Neomarinimicrobiota bacterium]MCF7880578.1 hypothetical protein [Candidatus Neomarinimicrobiota bacterium]